MVDGVRLFASMLSKLQGHFFTSFSARRSLELRISLYDDGSFTTLKHDVFESVF